MDEVSKLIEIIDSLQKAEVEQDYLARIEEFERFLVEMKIDVKKKRVLQEREDLSVQTVFINQ